MKKLAVIASLFFVGNVAADEACKNKTFKTELVKKACAEGGQKKAKDEMKKFMREAKKKDAGLTCNSCHSSLAPKYALKPDALEKFKSLGGALITAAR